MSDVSPHSPVEPAPDGLRGGLRRGGLWLPPRRVSFASWQTEEQGRTGPAFDDRRTTTPSCASGRRAGSRTALTVVTDASGSRGSSRGRARSSSQLRRTAGSWERSSGRKTAAKAGSIGSWWRRAVGGRAWARLSWAFRGHITDCAMSRGLAGRRHSLSAGISAPVARRASRLRWTRSKPDRPVTRSVGPAGGRGRKA